MSITIVPGQTVLFPATSFTIRHDGANSTTFAREKMLRYLLHGDVPSHLAGLIAGSGRPNIYASLHEGDPGEGGTQATNELDNGIPEFAGYQRALLTRSSAGWTIDEPSSNVWRGRNAVAANFGVSTEVSDFDIVDPWIGFGTSGTKGQAGTLLWRLQYNVSGQVSVFTNTAETDLANLLLFGFPPSWDGTGWTVAGPYQIFVSAHHTSPGIDGDQDTNEVPTAGYARDAPASWSIGTDAGDARFSNSALVDLGTMSGGTGAGNDVANFYGLGTEATGAGLLLGFGSLVNPVPLSVGVPLQFAIGDVQLKQK